MTITSCTSSYWIPEKLTILLATAVVLALAACTDAGDTSADISMEEALDAASLVESGRISYMTYCLNCHGEDGAGNGPLTELITLEPADLTSMAQSHGGTYPAKRVNDVIRGYDEELMIAHGDREMPIWELVWKEQSSEADAEVIVDARVAELIAFLESIQD
jgi:cytochrome c553